MNYLIDLLAFGIMIVSILFAFRIIDPKFNYKSLIPFYVLFKKQEEVGR